jgi:hypothetical protein
VANVLAFVVGVFVVGVDGNAAPLAAVLMSGAAVLQLWLVRVVLNRRRPEARRG